MLHHPHRPVQINIHRGQHILQIQRFNRCVSGGQDRRIINNRAERPSLPFQRRGQRGNSRFVRHIQCGYGQLRSMDCSKLSQCLLSLFRVPDPGDDSMPAVQRFGSQLSTQPPPGTGN
ncbi:hypothetical protein D3C75_1106860 [compost metagenome]